MSSRVKGFIKALLLMALAMLAWAAGSVAVGKLLMEVIW